MPAFLMVAWGIWITAVFLLDRRHPHRSQIIVSSLCLIILYPLELTLFSCRISVASMVLLLFFFAWTNKNTCKQNVYLVISSFVIMLGYAAFMLLQLFDPVWIFMDSQVLLCTGLFIASWILYPSSFLRRIPALMIGTMQGEVLVAFELGRAGIPSEVGLEGYLNIMACLFATLWAFHYTSRLLSDLRRTLDTGIGGEMEDM